MKSLQGEAWLHSRGKRTEDMLLSASILPIAGPAMIAGLLAVRQIDKVDPIFRQERIGRNDEPFEIIKIRTMPGVTEHTPSNGHNDERASRIGKLLRKLRIDEAPQLKNVKDGTMSVIGPRPLVAADYENAREVLDTITYKEWREARRIARPGIFDSFGIDFHGSELILSKTELFLGRVECDITYVEEASLKTDMVILGKAFGLLAEKLLPIGEVS